MKTQRLTLRQPVDGDAEDLWSHTTDPSITEFLAWEPHKDISQTKRVIEALRTAQEAERGYHWVILRDQTPIGLISLIDLQRTHLSWTLDRAELAYWVALGHQRQGFATEASRAVIGFGFETLALAKIRVAHAARNEGSRVVSERLGFRKYAVERRAFRKNGHWHDLVWYDILADEFFGQD